MVRRVRQWQDEVEHDCGCVSFKNDWFEGGRLCAEHMAKPRTQVPLPIARTHHRGTSAREWLAICAFWLLAITGAFVWWWRS